MGPQNVLRSPPPHPEQVADWERGFWWQSLPRNTVAVDLQKIFVVEYYRRTFITEAGILNGTSVRKCLMKCHTMQDFIHRAFNWFQLWIDYNNKRYCKSWLIIERFFLKNPHASWQQDHHDERDNSWQDCYRTIVDIFRLWQSITKLSFL